MKKKVLLAVEDPGGANSLLALAQALATESAIEICYAVKGAAKQLFAKCGLHTSSSNIPEIFESFKPDIVIMGTGEAHDSIDKQALLEARQRNITSIYVIDYWTNSEKRLADRNGNSLFYQPDFLIVIDKEHKKEFAELGFDPKKIEICGHPHFSRIKKEYEALKGVEKETLFRRIFPKLDYTKPVILFASETLGGALFQKTSEYTLNGRGSSNERTLIVLEELLDACSEVIPEAQIAIRPHPKNLISDFSAYTKEVDGIFTLGTSLEASFCATIVAGMTSMMLLEAAYIGKAVISIVPRKSESEWLQSNRFKASQCT